VVLLCKSLLVTLVGVQDSKVGHIRRIILGFLFCFSYFFLSFFTFLETYRIWQARKTQLAIGVRRRAFLTGQLLGWFWVRAVTLYIALAPQFDPGLIREPFLIPFILLALPVTFSTYFDNEAARFLCATRLASLSTTESGDPKVVNSLRRKMPSHLVYAHSSPRSCRALNQFQSIFVLVLMLVSLISTLPAFFNSVDGALPSGITTMVRSPCLWDVVRVCMSAGLRVRACHMGTAVGAALGSLLVHCARLHTEPKTT